jgi:hypothetical protein
VEFQFPLILAAKPSVGGQKKSSTRITKLYALGLSRGGRGNKVQLATDDTRAENPSVASSIPALER